MDQKQQTPTGANQPGQNNKNVSDNDYSTLKDAALSYAKMGWPVFPLHSIKNDNCTCGDQDCSKSPSAGKHPRTQYGFKDASTLMEQIKFWWTRWPDANIGIATGSESKIAVLDVDPRHGGPENLDLLENEFGLLPDTLISQTGGRGRHYFFKYPDGGIKSTAGVLASGVDTRGDGGYVVAPPSNHISGGTYDWQDDEPHEIELAEMPTWILEKLNSPPDGPENQKLYSNDAYKEGERNASLTSLAGKLRHSGLDEQEIADALLMVNNNRCKPPLPESEVLGIAKSVSRYPKGEHNGTHTSTPQWPEPLSEEAYYGLAGEIVRTIEPHTEADPAALLLQLLAAFGNVVGRGAYFVAEADRHHPNLFLILVGATSKGRKGSSWGQIENLFKSVNEDWSGACKYSGLSSGEGLIWIIRDPIEKTEPIRDKKQITGYQQVITDPGKDDKRALVLESEFCSPLKVMGREGNTLSPIIRNAFDGKDLQSMTKNSPGKATNPHISIIGHITKDELIRHVDSTELCNGFINRFLLVCVCRSKALPEGGKIHEVDLNPLITKLREAVNFAQGVGELKRDEKALALWCEVYTELSEGKPGLVGAATARAEPLVMRLATIYALLDCSNLIKLEHLMAGIAVWEYCEASAYFVFEKSLGDPLADEIQRSLDSRPDGMTRTEVSKLFNRHKKADQIERALNTLREKGTAYCINKKGDGRSVEQWFSENHSAN